MEEGRKRKTRSDKKHKYLLRMEQKMWDRIRVLSFNTRLSYNVILDKLITASLENEEVINALYLVHPRESSYIMIREES